MSTEKQLTTTQQEPSVALMLQAVIDRGITSENVAALETLCGLYERMEDRNAGKMFTQAFVELQAEMPAVAATKPVPNKDGSIRYNYAPFEEIMETVRPMLKKHGFTVTFDTHAEEKRMTVVCTLMHVGGHSRSNSYSTRIGSGPPGSSETQADGAAITYAKRGALSQCLNIVIDSDDDARQEGSPITQEQADMLRKRVKDLRVSEEKFLKFAGAAHYEAIMDSRLPELIKTLNSREAAKKGDADEPEHKW